MFWFLLAFAIMALALPAFANELAANGYENWLGTYEGVYLQGQMDTALVVGKTVDTDKALVIYKWGKSPVWRIWEAGEKELVGKFLNEKTLQINTGLATVTYTMNEDGTLTAEYSTKRGNVYATLKKKS
ncbi:MAG: hypothetical protein HYS78_02230 [Parcubacteria group bacterium]|nr:hypothetical protein [Parcubacteria group bacterium]